ncbi:retrovirus-related pol polyprotein from transposon TNT 1-94 [Tanacetum coccineum]
MIPIFTYQKLIGHINGTSISPSPKVTIKGKANPNPDLLIWTKYDQRAVILLQLSLTEEAAAEVLGLTTAHQIWLSLEAAYSNASVERIHLLRDSLRQLKKGTSSVSDYCRRFKALCNQLSAIGYPVVEIDKLHWFLCGLGPSYETFSTAIRATKPAPMFHDLVTQAESHELFLQSLHGTPTPPAVFHVETTNTDSAQGGGRSNRGNHSRGRGRGHNRRPPHCQLCLTNGHYATTCPSLYTYATQASPSSDESLAKAFHAQCHVNTNTPNWHVDSGATDHMTPACDSLHHSSPYPGNAKVMFGNGKTLPITHTGSTTVSHDIPLRNVLVIPKLNKKLLSVSKLTTDHPVDVLFSQPFFYIHDRKTKRVLARGRCEHGLYVLKDEPTAFIATAKVIKPASYELWHARLGHVSFDVISTLNKLGVLSITSLLPKPILCTPCQLAKGQRLPFTINAKRSSHPLDLIHCDLWGPAPICSKDGYRYYVAFIDDYSRFTWLYPLKTKTGFYSVLPVFINLVQTQCSRKIKTFQSDGGTEFVNQIVRKIFEDNGTFHRFSCPYTPQQNGRAERKHRHIVETGLAMLFNAHVPASYWVDAFTTATFIINRLPTPLLKNKSPFELLFNQHPQYDNFRTYGCQVFPYLRDYSQHKLEPRSIPCIFIGYSLQHKGYRCLDPTTSRVFVTRHARFNETVFPFIGSSCNPNISTLELTTFLPDVPQSPSSPALKQNATPKTQPTSGPTPCSLCRSSDPNQAAQVHTPNPITSQHSLGVQDTISVHHSDQVHIPANDSDLVHVSDPENHPLATHIAPDQPTTGSSTSSHPMTTRSKAGIFKHKHHADLASLTTHPLHVALLSTTEPRGFKTAAKDPKWMEAMNEEFQALQQNQTWVLVPRPGSANIIGSKWVYRIKYNSDGTIERYKARLVAQGCSQIPGLDYYHTFSPVVKASTVRIVISLAVLHKWNQADTSLFVFTSDTCIMYLLVYVDDLILTGNDESVIATFTSHLNHEFSIKDLGALNYFLGLEVSYTDNGLFLTQSKYARDILKQADLYDSKPVSTPLATYVSFTADGIRYSDSTLYRSLVWALQYLTITRPDLSYAVNQVSQFLHAPTIVHFQSVKRILWYFKGTISFGLTFSRPHTNTIIGYSYVDWARCLDTCRSTYGYSIYLGGNLVSWSAKKQPTVSRSSCESEYQAMANTATEINPVSHKRAKHIDLDYHFIRELVHSGKLYMKFVPTNLQVADIFTKSLPRSQFETFRTMLQLGPPPFQLKGDING